MCMRHDVGGCVSTSGELAVPCLSPLVMFLVGPEVCSFKGIRPKRATIASAAQRRAREGPWRVARARRLSFEMLKAPSFARATVRIIVYREACIE